MHPVDPDAVAEWMSGQGLGEGPLYDVCAVTGGTQNVMLRFTRSGRTYVLRRGPRHLRPRSNSVILRETKVLAALAGTDVPHPRLIAACPDPTVLGDAVFYLMEPVEGFNAGEGLPPLHAGDASIRFQMGLSMADALAKLGAVDHAAVGLADFGKPAGFLERQVPRWLAELESYQQYDGYPGPDIPGIGEVSCWLDSHRPTAWTPGILHGDYHMANVMFSRTGPEVVAICDWEMCTIGDPLLDLAWSLLGYDGEEPRADGFYLDMSAMPKRSELLEHYEKVSGLSTENIDYYLVLANWKLGIVLEKTYAAAMRAGPHAGGVDPKIKDAFAAMIPRLIATAAELARATKAR